VNDNRSRADLANQKSLLDAQTNTLNSQAALNKAQVDELKSRPGFVDPTKTTKTTQTTTTERLDPKSPGKPIKGGKTDPAGAAAPEAAPAAPTTTTTTTITTEEVDLTNPKRGNGKGSSRAQVAGVLENAARGRRFVCSPGG
jgi:hypothetical protein